MWRAWKCRVDWKEESKTRFPGCQIIESFLLLKTLFPSDIIWCLWVQHVHQNGKLGKLNVKYPSDLHPTVNLPVFCAEKWPHSSWPVTCSSLYSISRCCCLRGWHSAKKALPVLTHHALVSLPEWYPWSSTSTDESWSQQREIACTNFHANHPSLLAPRLPGASSWLLGVFHLCWYLNSRALGAIISS